MDYETEFEETQEIQDEFDTLETEAEPRTLGGVPIPEGANQVTVQGPGGPTIVGFSGETITLAELCRLVGFNIGGESQMWVGSTIVTDLATEIGPGANVTLTSPKKGG